MNELKMCECGEPTYSDKCSLCRADESVEKQPAQQEPTKDQVQAAFEEWLERTSPSDDVEAVQRQWESSNECVDLYTSPPAQPEQEPVAFGMLRADGLILDVICPDEHESFAGEYTIPLYTTPPKRPWVGLTATAKLDLLSTAKGAGGRINGDAQLLELLNEHETQIKRKNT